MSSVNGAVSGRLQLQASGLPWSVSTAVPPWSLCVWTFLCLEKSKGGIENVLVVTDHFSRYAQAYLTKYQKACTVAQCSVDNPGSQSTWSSGFQPSMGHANTVSMCVSHRPTPRLIRLLGLLRHDRKSTATKRQRVKTSDQVIGSSSKCVL